MRRFRHDTIIELDDGGDHDQPRDEPKHDHMPSETMNNSTPAPPKDGLAESAPEAPGNDSTPSPTTEDSPVPIEEQDSGSALTRTVQGHYLRWWVGVAAGLAVSIPLAWLLSYAATLPFLLGTFFFMLFGLVIGAVIFRVVGSGFCYGRWSVLFGTTLVVVVGWGAAMIQESRDFPSDMATDAIKRTRNIGGKSAEEFRTSVAADVRKFLIEHYPPGGVLGYARWVLTDGELKRGTLEGVPGTLVASQRRWTWAIRVVISLALFAYAISSQTLGLASPKPTGDELSARGKNTLYS